MGVRNFFVRDSHLGFMNKGSVDRILYGKMAPLISSCWFCITTSLLFVIRFIAIHIVRIKIEENSQSDHSCVPAVKEWKGSDSLPESTALALSNSKNLAVVKEWKGSEPVPESTSLALVDSKNLELSTKETERKEWDDDAFSKEEASSFSFKFQYQFSDDNMSSSSRDLASPVFKENPRLATTDIRKSSLLLGNDFSGFMEGPEAMTLIVQESYVGCGQETTNDDEKLDPMLATRFLLTKDFKESDASGKPNKSVDSKDVVLFKDHILYDDQTMRSSLATDSLNEKVQDGARFLSEGFSGFDSDSESESLNDGYSVKNLAVDSDTDSFLSERDFGGHEHGSNATETSMDSSIYGVELLEDIRRIDRQLQLLNDSDSKSPDSSGWLADSSDDQLSSFRTDDSSNLSSTDEVLFAKDSVGLEPTPKNLDGEDAGRISVNSPSSECHMMKLHNSDTEFNASISGFLEPIVGSKQMDATLLGRDSDELTDIPEDIKGKKKAPDTDLQKSKETQLGHLDTQDLDELECLWEHQDLIEQLKMEVRKARATGLPTILEESESPKAMEDLKPWKIDDNFSDEDPMDELFKFYKSYRERMRRFDILNYQKMYAIGFLKLEDPFQSIGSQKPLIQTIMTNLSGSIWPFCRRKSKTDPSEKFLKELQSDLETVYVGQTCLSWEFLRWQYEKARGLPESDPYRSRQYNQVAGEFQQFQVIIQRFVENESFQGPRLPNYVKNRCVLRNLLQVPVIKEDCLEDKMEERKKGNNVITSELLENSMEESIRVFWEFVKADKHETPLLLRGLTGLPAELQDPSDLELLIDAWAILQKKEKKLKDLLRTGNCLVKKFKKTHEDRSNQDLFFSQVDLKLVAMVLKMSRITTDQLVWCHKKMNNIKLRGGKIRREPAFLLFPC